MIHDEAVDNKRTERKFTLPNVREGSIIEYIFTIRSDYLSIPDWQFQYTVPALWSEYRVGYPEYLNYKKLQKGYLSFDINDNTTESVSISMLETSRGEGLGTRSTINNYKLDYQQNTYRWLINNVPAFKEEPYMNALINYISSIDFELASYKFPYGMVKNFTQTWEKINEDMLSDEDFGLQVKRGGFLKEVAAQIKSTNTDPTQQMIAAFEYVRGLMKWDGRERVYVTQSLRNVYEKKSGSSADINLLLVTLMKELGIDSDPVILSTRSNGMVFPSQIMLGQFNYVIASAKIGEKAYLMDATEKACPYNILMPRCINGQGRIISESRQGWIDLNSTHRYEYTNLINASIEKDGTIKGKIQRMYGNYAALDKRIEINGKIDHDDYIRSIENNYQGLTISNYELNDLDSLNKPYTEVLDVEITDASLIAGNILTITPLLYYPWVTNPFKMEDRKFPVDYTYPRIYKYIVTFELPEGYILDEKPANLVLAMPDGKTKFTYRLNLNGRILQVSSTLDIGKALYNSDEYALLKEFYGNLVKKQAEKVVLKKAI
jgi:hypothetical protein